MKKPNNSKWQKRSAHTQSALCCYWPLEIRALLPICLWPEMRTEAGEREGTHIKTNCGKKAQTSYRI